VLTISPDDGGAVLNWSGEFTLQTATNPSGRYADWPLALSPFTNDFALDEPQRYFRLRVSDPLLNGGIESNGAFLVGLTGSPGRIYRVEASTNLQDWSSLMDDASPFGMLDTNAPSLPQRFYRARLLP
jgi:hypothetical protein